MKYIELIKVKHISMCTENFSVTLHLIIHNQQRNTKQMWILLLDSSSHHHHHNNNSNNSVNDMAETIKPFCSTHTRHITTTTNNNNNKNHLSVSSICLYALTEEYSDTGALRDNDQTHSHTTCMRILVCVRTKSTTLLVVLFYPKATTRNR